MTCFIVIDALLWWSGTEPTISLRYACTQKKKKIPVVGAFKVGSLFFLTEMVNEYLLRMVHGEKNDNSYSFQNLKLLI